MSSGVLDNSERLGALPRHPECSALVIAELEAEGYGIFYDYGCIDA
jgi:hypothetical protein